MLAAFLGVHAVVWWIILNILLAGTQQMFLGFQIAAGVGELWLMNLAIVAVEKRIRRRAAG